MFHAQILIGRLFVETRIVVGEFVVRRVKEYRLAQIGALVIFSVLASCGGVPAKKNVASEPESDLRGGGRAKVGGVPAPALRAPREPLVNRLMSEAEEAFRDGRLFDPESSNAFDLFQSVLVLDSGNTQARSGLQAVLIRYADLVRDAIKMKRFKRAKALLVQANNYYPANALLMDLQASLNRAQRQVERHVVVKKKPPVANDEILLPKDALNQKSDALIETLVEIAQRVKGTNESVMIYARNDAEGRWIYRQMKKAASDYRVRGDIRISSKPRIALLPPI